MIEQLASSNKHKDKHKEPRPPQLSPNYTIWVSNDAYVRMLIISTILEVAFPNVKGTTTSRDVWLSLEHDDLHIHHLESMLLKLNYYNFK